MPNFVRGLEWTEPPTKLPWLLVRGIIPERIKFIEADEFFHAHRIAFMNKYLRYYMVIDDSIDKGHLLAEFREALELISKKLLDESKSSKFYVGARPGWAWEEPPIALEIWSKGFVDIEFRPLYASLGLNDYAGGPYALIPFRCTGGRVIIALPLNEQGSMLVRQFNECLNTLELLSKDGVES
jgi:hypothetical protein